MLLYLKESKVVDGMLWNLIIRLAAPNTSIFYFFKTTLSAAFFHCYLCFLLSLAENMVLFQPWLFLTVHKHPWHSASRNSTGHTPLPFSTLKTSWSEHNHHSKQFQILNQQWQICINLFCNFHGL